MYGMVMGGMIMMLWDLIFPYVPLPPFMKMSFQIMGAMLIVVGIILYDGRCRSTTANQLTPMPKPSNTICLHMGKSGAKLITAKKEEPNRLRAKTKRGWMNIKDCGDAINVAGHDFVITSQDCGHTFPLWLVDAVSKWKKKWNTRNEAEFDNLYEELSKVEYYEDLEKIEFLQPILADPEKKQVIVNMDLDDIRNMRELLFDGRTIDIKAYLDWSEGATPYDNESIISSTVARHRAEDASLKYGGFTDWGKYVLPIIILFIGGAIAYQIFGG